MKRGMVLLTLAVLVLLANSPAGRTGGKANPILDAAKEKVADPKKPFTMVVFVTLKKDKGKEFEEAFRPAIKATRQEKGCIAYDLNRDSSDPNKYYVYERWQSLPALEKHLETAHIKELLSKIGDMLASPPEPKFFAIVGE